MTIFINFVLILSCLSMGDSQSFPEDTVAITEETLNKTIQQDFLFGELEGFVAPYEIRKNFPYYVSGYDSEKRPIWVIEGGKWNVRSIVEQGQEAMDIFEKYAKQGFLRAQMFIAEKTSDEYPVTDDIVIVDFEGLNFVQVVHVPTVAYLMHLAREIRPVVMKTLFKGFAVNTNAVASTLINIARPILGPIFEKSEIFGNNRAKFAPQLLKYCPKDQIPHWYGGRSKNFKPVQVYG